MDGQPFQPKKYIIRREPEICVPGGYVWRAYDDEWCPLYIGDEDKEALKEKVRKFRPVSEFEEVNNE